tara:strand:+ start:5020 stop:10974 length:5955 start_codon:yes stop_codon:yes gene_type:complete
VREDALQYHQRMVNQFAQAIINKQDARDEAVNLLLSANNLENNGYAYPIFKEQAEDFLKPLLEIKNPSDKGMERIFSSKTTRHEPTPTRHHKARGLFHSDDWVKAMMEGNENAIDMMVRLFAGRRFKDTIPDIAGRGVDGVVGKHSKLKALNLHPPRKGEVAFGEKSLWQHLSKFLYGNGGANAERLNDAMVKVANNMNPILKQPHLFSNWRGNNATIMKMYQRGKDDFIKAFGERFGKNHPLLSSKMLDEYYLRQKNWENEGIPREEIFDVLYEENGNPASKSKKSDKSPVDLLRELADTYNDTRRRPKEGEANFGRVGDDAYRLGIAMLPYDDIYRIKRWMLETSGGMKDDGTVGNDKVINEILGPDARGYMAHHAFMIDNMLHTLHAGGAERNGMSHVLPNRFLNKTKEEVMRDIDARHEEIRRRLKEGRWGTLGDDALQDALQGVDFSPKVAEFVKNRDDVIVVDDDDNPIYPHIDHSDYGTFVYMNSDLPDIRKLSAFGFFNQEELDDLIERSVVSYGSKEYTDLLRQSIADYTHTHNIEDEFDMLEEPTIYQSPLGILMEGVGSRRGNANGEWGDLGNSYDESMPNMIRVNLPTIAFMMPSRGERSGSGSQKTVEQQDEFDPKKETDGQLRRDLEEALQRYGVEDEEKYLDMFDNGKVVSLDVPRKEMTTQDVAEGIINPYTAENYPDSLPSPLGQIEQYVEGMPTPMSIATKGLHSFYMAHSNNFGLGMADFNGFFSLDGKPLRSTETALKTPMYSTRKERVNSQSKGGRSLFDRHQMSGDRKGSEARQLGITKNNHSNEDKLLIDAFLLGMHHPLHQHDDDSFELFNALMNAKEGERMDIIKKNTHKDIIGSGGRTGQDMLRELLQDVTEPSHHAIYHKEDYDDHMVKLMNFNEPYELPEAQIKGIKSRGRLIQSIKELDQQYRRAFEEGDEEKKNELHKQIETMLNDKDNIVGYREHEDGLSALVVGPTPSYLASQHYAMLESALQKARNTGNEDAQEMIEKRMMEVRRQSPPYDGGEIKLNNHEARLQNHVNTLLAKEKIFKVLRPAIEKIYPDVYTGDVRKATAATAYTLKLAEQIAMLSPDERKKLFGGKDNIRIGGKSASFDLSEDEVEELANLNVKRKTHLDSSFVEGSKMVDNTFGGVQPKGYRVLSHLAKDSNNIDEDEIKIFDQLISSVKQAAKEQEISFQQAFAARYYPTNSNGIPLKGQDRSFAFDALEGMKRRVGGMGFNEGGLFRGSPIFRHGGESILDKKNKPVSMNKEREIIFKMLYNGFSQTREGSDAALDFKGMSFFKGYDVKRAKKVMDFNKLDSLDNISSLLDSVTKTRIFDQSSHEDVDTNMGGYDFKNAPVVPIATSADKKFHGGIGTPVPFIARPDSLNQGMLYLEDENEHVYNPPPAQQLVTLSNMIRRVNPTLPPLPPSKPGDKYYPNYAGFDNEPNPNIRMGQAANQAMFTGTEALQSTDDSLRTYSSHLLDVALDDTLIIKEDGKPQPIKFMHRIFELGDLEHLRGFVGDWVISLYPQGEHIIATKKGDKITAYGADGEVKLDDVFNEEASKVYEKDFVVHAILHDGVMTVIDLLKTADEDTHNMPTKDRIRHLRAQYESSEHIKMPEPINTKRSDDEGLQVAIDGLRNENNMDILLRDANATYMKGEPRHPKWVLLSKEKMVDVVILSRNGKSYTIGVGPLMHPENYGKRAQQVGEEHYMNVGSAKGPRGLKVGDFATVRCTGVSSSNGEHTTYRVRSAKITDDEPLAADSVETLAVMSGDHHIPQQVNMKKGKITILFPAFDDEVICKTRKEEGYWYVEPESSLWGNDYLVELARDQEAYWIAKAAWLLMKEEEEGVEQPEYDEVTPEPPAGHSKKRKHVLEDEEEVIKHGLELIERGLEHLSKEKITSTGVQGLGMDYATYDESPRGPTENIRDNTMPDFDPQARRDDELKPATGKKKSKLRTSQGEVARLEDDGVLAIENSSIDIP